MKIKLEDFYPIIRVIGEIFQNKLSPEAVDIYYQILGNYNKEELQEASMQVLYTYKYNCMPKPAEFIDIISEARRRKAQNQDDKPLKLYHEPSEEDLKKIRDLVAGVVNKCK